MENPQLDGSSTPWGVRRIRGMLRKSRLCISIDVRHGHVFAAPNSNTRQS